MTTLGNDPGFINSSGGSPEYDAADLRLLDTVETLSDGSALGARAGVRPSSVEGLEPSVSGGTYTVSPGLAVISKDVDGALGAYRVALSAAVVELVPAADSVNARKDVIYLRVFDTDVDGLGLREGQVVYDEGTPSPTPVEPSVPADALFLASVDVPAAGGGNPTLQDRRVYTVASGGVLPTGVYPPAPYVGQTVYRTDTDTLEVFTSSGWVVVAEDTLSTSALGTDPAFALNAGTANNRTGWTQIRIDATANGAYNGGNVIATIPVGFRPAEDFYGVLVNGNTGNSGRGIRCRVDGYIQPSGSGAGGDAFKGTVVYLSETL
jgi:hypothetical protein